MMMIDNACREPDTLLHIKMVGYKAKTFRYFPI